MGIFRKLFGTSAPPFDPDLAAASLVNSLPRARSMSSSLHTGTRGTIGVGSLSPAEYLADFARRYAERTIGGSHESEAARVAMPTWLSRASRDGKSSYMPLPFVQNVDAYVLKFIKDGAASVYCNDCGAVVREFQEQSRNVSRAGPWSEWTSAGTARGDIFSTPKIMRFISSMRGASPNKLFDTDAQLRLRLRRSWLCAGQRQRWASQRSCRTGEGKFVAAIQAR